jgi:hypothetical protein
LSSCPTRRRHSYLVRLSDVCGVDLAAAVKDKLKKNAAK